MSRFARHSSVYFIEEPVYDGDRFEVRRTECPNSGVEIVTPIVPQGSTPDESINMQRNMVESLISRNRLHDFVAWYYTPMALNFTDTIRPNLTVYDCMDELSAFAGAPAAMRRNEEVLFEKSDLVFTGGRSLFELKQRNHPAVYLFPSSVDVAHFARALSYHQDPEDQKNIPHPRLGFIGVIDERMDLELIGRLARCRPDWHILMIGPVVKIDPATLPRAANIHYLGMKSYSELPAYLSTWDVALLPFALNRSTRFISPTKTPEYLAAGCPVVSTPIRDVVNPYGELGLVKIAGTPEQYVEAVESILTGGMPAGWRADVSAFLDQLSWDRTWRGMRALMEERLSTKAVLASAMAVGAGAGARRAS